MSSHFLTVRLSPFYFFDQIIVLYLCRPICAFSGLSIMGYEVILTSESDYPNANLSLDFVIRWATVSSQEVYYSYS